MAFFIFGNPATTTMVPGSVYYLPTLHEVSLAYPSEPVPIRADVFNHPVLILSLDHWKRTADVHTSPACRPFKVHIEAGSIRTQRRLRTSCNDQEAGGLPFKSSCKRKVSYNRPGHVPSDLCYLTYTLSLLVHCMYDTQASEGATSPFLCSGFMSCSALHNHTLYCQPHKVKLCAKSIYYA